MKILFCDEHIIVGIKPAGAVSMDEPGGMPELIRRSIGEDRTVRTVHRLDSVVSGLMVYALSKNAASGLGIQMENGTFEKEYMAVVEGSPVKDKGELRDYLFRNRRERKTYVTDSRNRNAQEAILTYQVCKKRQNISLVRVKLITGRTHQIRCQFSSRGLPLYGDSKYGSVHKAVRIALWSYQLSFCHPVSGEPMRFSALPPAREPWNVFKGYCDSYEAQDLEVEFVRSERFSDCPYAEICGFCAYQGMEYEKQLEKKQRKGSRWLRELGTVQPMIAAEDPLGYRNKMTIDFGTDKNGKLVSGLYSRKTRKVVRIGKCQLDHPKLKEISNTLSSLLVRHNILAYEEKTNTGWIRQASLRISTTGEVMIVLTAAADSSATVFAMTEELRVSHPEITSVLLDVQKKGEKKHKELQILFGKAYLEENWLGQPFWLNANSFFPLHLSQSQKVYETALQYASLKEEDRGIDVFCASGILALAAAAQAKRMFAVDASERALKEAEERAKRGKIENLRFVHAQPELYLQALANSKEKFDVLFFEAARCRNTKDCITALGKLLPKRIVYIGDSSETMGKDLKELLGYGYQVQQIQTIDVLPFTEHIETVVLLEHKNAGWRT